MPADTSVWEEVQSCAFLSCECCSQETEELGSSVDALRAEPLGVDAKGGRYWFFGTAAQEDCWLYRERVPETVGFTETWGPSGLNEPPWAAVCTTLAEMQDMTERLGAAEDNSEQLLAAVRCNSVLPVLPAWDPPSILAWGKLRGATAPLMLNQMSMQEAANPACTRVSWTSISAGAS